MDLDVRRLRLLREVALRGTIAATAAALSYTPSAVSQQLSALERESGTSLLDRTGRRARLTDAGRLLVERTEAILVALEAAAAALEAAQGTLSGELRIGASGSVARALVVPVVAQLMADTEDLRITLVEGEPDTQLRALRLSELDLVVANEYEHDRRPLDPDLTRVDLFVEQLLVAAPAGRLHGPVDLVDLAGLVWAAEPPESACGRAVRVACRSVGFEPDVRYVSTESAGLLAAVKTGTAVAVLPELSVTEPPPEIDVLPLVDTGVRRHVFVAHRQGSALRPSVVLLLERLQAAASILRRG